MNFWDQHKTITCYYAMLTRNICDKFGLTQMEYAILMFLHNNPQYNTAADIVRGRKATKSHVSAALKLLEDNGLVMKKQSADNKKRIEIVLLESAQEIIQEGLSVQKEFIKNIFQDLTDEEMSMWKGIFTKICGNAEKCLQDR
ncbi:transcriptional regulator SlyA [Gemella morbillorum]|uniref:MarR family transcriptional regulator n=1 Tax=Gemella morbillorum TaxID=29391 RepID=UPI000DA3E823|nr:MarR family transcriptional regulator [Gemella morbillorum]UBH80724.1 MarR family transcriptional regulator [Gemella morbillorum]SQH56127.1 transcriptional regulator SlyA [Gemella morbillorum]